MDDALSPTVPRWCGANIEEVLDRLRQRYQHSPNIVARYEAALRGKLLMPPQHVIADTTRLHAELTGWSPGQISSAKESSWAACWEFPDQVDWYMGDPPGLIEEIMTAIGEERLRCRSTFPFRGRQYMIIYICLDSADDIGLPRSPSTLVHGVAIAPADCLS